MGRTNNHERMKQNPQECTDSTMKLLVTKTKIDRQCIYMFYNILKRNKQVSP